MKKLIAVLALATVMGATAPVIVMAHEGHKQAADSQTAEGEGVVKGIDKDAGTVTIQHGPIKALKWPAMTMKFKATPEAIASAKVGQKVHFVMKNDNGQPLVTAIHAM